MLQSLRKTSPSTRRRLLEDLARTAMGVSALPAITNAATAPLPVAGAARHVIYLFMQGAMSHIDTFDPKPGKESGGETKAIQTSLPGVRIGEHLPLLAKRMKDLTLIRSMTTETAAHDKGAYLMRTSYRMINSIRHPFMGSWLTHVKGRLNYDLPGCVVVGAANRHPGAGYLEADVAPAPVGDPKLGLQNTKPPKYLDEKNFEVRQKLISRFEGKFRSRYSTTEVKNYLDYYREAVRLLNSPDLVAFDINKESEETRQKYGESRIGQGCLLARRLVEQKVRFVEVEFSGWDNHKDIYSGTGLPGKAASLDQAITALLTDLQQRGLLDSTMVVLATEFGRTPAINPNAGRDHHPGAYSCLLAGAGIRSGQVFGKTDENGRSVEDGHCYPQDLNATIAQACGLPVTEEFRSPGGRPFLIAHEGTPVKELLQ